MKRIILMLIVLVIVFLGGCNKEQEEQFVQTEYDPNDWDGKEDAEEVCQRIIDKISDSKIWDAQLTEEEKEVVEYHNISEDGLGIIMMYFWDEGMLAFRNYVYISHDYGATWVRQNEYAHTFKRTGSIFSINNHIFVLFLEGSNMAGFWSNLYASHDAGVTFEEVNLCQVVGIPDMYDFLIEFEVQEIDYAKERMVLKWLPHDDNFKASFLTAEYNMDFYCVKVRERNDTFYEVLGKVRGDQFAFPDSDRRLLTKEEMEEYKLACDILNACSYFDSYEELIRQAINEIYARRGYDFSKTQYGYMYESYQKTYCEYIYTDMETVASMFNEYERANVEFLANLRSEYQK